MGRFILDAVLVRAHEKFKKHKTICFNYIFYIILLTLTIIAARGAVRLIMVLGAVSPVAVAFLVVKGVQRYLNEKEDMKIHTRVFLGTIKSGAITLSKEHSAFCWKTIQEIEKMENVIYKESLLQYLKEAERI